MRYTRLQLKPVSMLPRIVTVICCFSLLMLSACREVEITDKDNLLIGYWESVSSTEEESGTIYHMKRIDYFRDKYGTMFFSADGNFALRSSWGFTGQPTNFTGTWAALNDTVLQIEIAQPFQEDWKIAIKKVNREAMEYYYVYFK